MKKEKTFDNSNTTTNSKQLEVLKTNFPQCFDKKGDFIPRKMQEVVAKEGINLSKESYSLNWLGKSYARLLANEQPLTLLKEDTKHNQKQTNKNSENLLIKGDNLEVLKHLRRAYSQSIKMIYIDPPYNTGSDDFVYQDDRKFTPEQLQHLAGIDEDEAQRILDFTNSNSNSHSAWLTFIYPRLYIARELLTDDGVIFISIDDNEQAQLKMLCDEVFGEDNFRNSITIKRGVKSVQTQFKNIDSLNSGHESVFCYTRNTEYRFEHLKEMTEKHNLEGSWNNHWRGTDRKTMRYELFGRTPDSGQYRWSEERSKKGIDNYFSLLNDLGKNENDVTQQEIDKWYFKKINKHSLSKIDLLRKNSKTGKAEHYIDPKDYKLLSDLWVSLYASNSSVLKKLFSQNIFTNPKDTRLIVRLCNFCNLSSNEIIMDIFAGSGTTADAVMQLNAKDGGNRKCISVQLPEPIDKNKNKTAYDFVKNELGNDNPTIFDITKERIIRAVKKIQTDNEQAKKKDKKDLSQLDTGFKVFETLPMFKGYFDEMDALDEQQALFDGTRLSNEDLTMLLTSWMVNDGIKLTANLEIITLDKYTGYYADKKLYLMDKGFTTDDLKALLEKLDNDKDFQPNKIILFGYNFESKHQREISEALKSYTNKKQIELNRVIRY